MKGNDLPAVRRMWTQTTEPVVLLSDTCDDDSDDDGNDRSDGTGNKNGRKKRKKFRILNRKLDFSHVKSKTDSNYKDGKVHTETGTGTKNVPNCKDGMTDTNEKHGNLPVVYIDSGDPNKNDAEVARLKRLLAEVSFFFHRVVVKNVSHVLSPFVSGRFVGGCFADHIFIYLTVESIMVNLILLFWFHLDVF